MDHNMYLFPFYFVLIGAPDSKTENSWPSFTFFSLVIASCILLIVIVVLNIVFNERLPIAGRKGTGDPKCRDSLLSSRVP